MTEIILRGDAATIRQALEARTQIDSLLEEREAAYQRIAELETQVSEIVGEEGTFPFPQPPMPVADYVTTAPAKKKAAAPAPVKAELAATPAIAESTAQIVANEPESAPVIEKQDNATASDPA